MEKIDKLKKYFVNYNIDGYVVPKNDEYFGEYVKDNKDRLKFITNFSGSYGFAIILRKNNYLFVDGRYTLQAEKQSGKFFKIKTIPQILPKTILRKKSLRIGYDPNLITRQFLNTFFNFTDCKLIPVQKNLIDLIWKRKNKSFKGKFYHLPDDAVGQNVFKKVSKLIFVMKKKRIDYQFITSSENSAWLLNLRGYDSKYTPIPHCVVLVDKRKKIKLFCDLKNVSNLIRKKYKYVEFLDTSKLNFLLSNIKKKKFSIDKNTCSISNEKIITLNNKIVNFVDPIDSFKAIKTKIEIQNIKRAHLYDGAALTRYLFWIKRNFKKKKISEISGEKKLLKFRKENKDFKFLSFPTISGSGPNGAIIHYRATNKTNRVLKKGDIYLVDSGGQYNFGTTDVTRTISLENQNKRIKKIFTHVLKGHLAVKNFKLNKKTSGSQIDFIARKFLKKLKLDYAHGTGHGVGYFLNVHEGPHAISKKNNVSFKEGMVVSNEPGYYEKNNFGIRIENLLYVKKNKNKIQFDNLTFAPIDKSLIDQSILKHYEKNWINEYHKIVFNKLKRFMRKEEILDLKSACSAI